MPKNTSCNESPYMKKAYMRKATETKQTTKINGSWKRYVSAAIAPHLAE